MTTRRLCGRKPKLTPRQLRELQAWDAARKTIPTLRGKARELGISETALRNYLADPYRKNHAMERREQ